MKKYFAFSMVLMTLLWSSCKKETTSSGSNSIPILENWIVTKRSHNLNINDRDMFFVNQNVGYVVGYNGMMFKTTNAGQIWGQQTTGTTLHLFSVYFVNEQIGFASGAGMYGCLDEDCDKGAVFLKTTNGGQTWEKTLFSNYESIKAMHFFDKDNGVAIIRTPYVFGTRNFHMAKTTDGGQNWELVDLEIKNYGDELYATGHTVFVSGENQELYRSVDMGSTWKEVQKPAIQWNYVRSMHFYDAQLGFLDGGSNYYKTVDGGLNWEMISIPMNTLDIFHCYNETEWLGIERSYTNTGGGMIDFLGSTGVQTMDEGVNWDQSKLYSNVSINRYHFPLRNIGFGMDNSDFYTIRRK